MKTTISVGRWIAVAFWACFGAISPLSDLSAQDTGNDEAEVRWKLFQSSFDGFARADNDSEFGVGGVLFLGSSIFREWTHVAEVMEPIPVLNRAFGGSRTGDQLARFEALVPRYRPEIIVYYCGSNDLQAGDDPDEIFARFAAFSEKARMAQPGVRLLFVSSMRSPDRVDRWDDVDRYNQLVKDYSERLPGHRFIDINPSLVDPEGEVRLEFFRADRLHLTPLGYDQFARIIKPVLEEIWLNRTAAPGRTGGNRSQ